MDSRVTSIPIFAILQGIICIFYFNENSCLLLLKVSCSTKLPDAS